MLLLISERPSTLTVETRLKSHYDSGLFYTAHQIPWSLSLPFPDPTCYSVLLILYLEPTSWSPSLTSPPLSQSTSSMTLTPRDHPVSGTCQPCPLPHLPRKSSAFGSIQPPSFCPVTRLVSPVGENHTTRHTSAPSFHLVPQPRCPVNLGNALLSLPYSCSSRPLTASLRSLAQPQLLPSADRLSLLCRGVRASGGSSRSLPCSFSAPETGVGAFGSLSPPQKREVSNHERHAHSWLCSRLAWGFLPASSTPCEPDLP